MGFLRYDSDFMVMLGRIADYVIFMYMGEIIEAGPAEQIFKNPRRSRQNIMWQ